jgi:hypothetical protein
MEINKKLQKNIVKGCKKKTRREGLLLMHVEMEHSIEPSKETVSPPCAAGLSRQRHTGHRDRHRDRETDRQTYRHTYRQTDIKTDTDR